MLLHVHQLEQSELAFFMIKEKVNVGIVPGLVTYRDVRRLSISVPLSNSKEACGTNHPLVIASKLHACSLSADELDGRQMDSVQCANWNRKGLKGAPQYRRHHFDNGNLADQAADGIAVRILKPTRIDPVPDFAFE